MVDEHSAAVFDPRAVIRVMELPEGTRSFNLFARVFLSKGERVYDPLWQYVKPVDRRIYRGQGAQVRIEDYSIGMRGPNRIFAYADFRKDLLYIGRKLVIPFNAIRALVAGQGMMPWRKTPVFVLMVRVSGCESYIPIHQCLLDPVVVDLADFLSSHMHAPFGIASKPLQFMVPPGGVRMIHSRGETPLYDLRGMITTRGPDGRTRIKLLTGTTPLCIVDEPDPMGWIERWGIIADDLVSIAARRAASRYGHGGE